jgi:Ca2+-binding RTX toxin-like protein
VTENFEGRGGNDTIIGNGGVDVASYGNDPADEFGNGINVQLWLGTDTVSGGFYTGSDELRGIEGISGTEFNDIYDASLFGTAGFTDPDVFNVGNNGTFNFFDGRGGDDTVTGNFGTRVQYTNAAAGVTVILGANGSGTAFDTASKNLAGIDTAPDDLAGIGTDTFVSGVNAVRGSEFGDILIGNGGNNALDGRGGNDVLKGLSADSGTSGNDTMTGGTGADIFVETSGAGAGVDTIADFNRSEGDLIDLRALNVSGFSGLTITENVDGDAVLTFASGASTLTLQGITSADLGGRDFLFHGAVAISVHTSDGYNFGTLYDDLAGADPDQPGNTATHFTAVNAAAGLMFSVISATGSTFTYDGSGNPTSGTVYAIDIYDNANNILVSTTGWGFDAGDLSQAISDYLSAGNLTAGLDAIFITGLNADPDPRYGTVGSVGPDTFISSVAGVRTEHFNGLTDANGDLFGGDTVDYSHTPGPSGVTVSLAISGEQDTIGAGIDALFNIENLRGSAFNDALTGDGGYNVLEGGPGDDTLNGGGGIDTASYEHVPDDGSGIGVTVDLSSLAPQNTVKAGTDTLSNIENLRGSGFADTLTGNTGNNVLEGGPDGDSLDGGGGSDTASYEHATAGVTANLADPDDPISPNTGEAAGDSYQFIENLFGSRFTDHLIGDANANVLDGGYGGNDVLTGLGGADTFVFHGGNRTITDFTSTLVSASVHDQIDLSGFFESDTDPDFLALLGDLTNAAAAVNTIDLGGNTITLAGVNVNSLQASDFLVQ